MILTPLLLLALQGYEADPRLAKPVALTEYAEPVKKIVDDLAKETGVTLYVEEHIRDDLVILVTKPRPAQETMTTLARHFGWRWTPAASSSYRLEPSEEFLRKARDWQEATILPPIRQQRDHVVAWGRELEKIGQKKLQEEFDAHTARLEQEKDDNFPLDALQRLDPFAPLFCQAIGSLTNAQLASNYDRRIVMSTSPGPLAIGLPGRIAAAIPKAIEDTIELSHRWQRKGDEYLSDGLALKNFSPLRVAEVRFEILRARSGSVTLLSEEGTVLYRDICSVPRASKPASPLIYTKEFKVSLDRWKPGNFTLRHPVIEPLRPVGEWFAKVAEDLHSDLIADAYDVETSMLQYVNLEGIVTRCQDLGVVVSESDGWLRVRSNRWPLYRASQVPRELWRALKGQRVADIDLNTRSDLAVRLTPQQGTSPLLGWPRTEYAFYRFWGTLPTTSRRTLWGGGRIPIDNLSNEGLEFLYLMGTETDGNGGGMRMAMAYSAFSEPEFGPEIEDADSEGGEVLDSDIASIYYRRLAPGAALTVQHADVPAIYVPNEDVIIAAKDLASFEESMGIEAALNEGRSPTDSKTRLAVLTPMSFQFDLRPGVRFRWTDYNYVLGKEVSNDPATWPADLRNRIQRQRAKAKQDAEPPPPPR